MKRPRVRISVRQLMALVAVVALAIAARQRFEHCTQRAATYYGWAAWRRGARVNYGSAEWAVSPEKQKADVDEELGRVYERAAYRFWVPYPVEPERP